MLALCRLIQRVALTQDGHVFAAVSLLRRDILDAAVSVNDVIPVVEGLHPVTRRRQCGQALAWKAR